VIAATLALLLAQREPVISLTFPAARLSVVVAEIGRQVTNPKFAVDAALAREVVAVRLTDALSIAMARLAEAVGGEWQDRNGVRTLLVSAAAARRDEVEREAKRTKAIQALIASLTPAESRKPPDEDAMRKAADMARAAIAKATSAADFKLPEMPSFDMPETVLLSELASMLPLSAYIGSRPNERLVFSDAPNGHQQPLPVAATAAISHYRHDRLLVDRYLLPVFRELAARAPEEERNEFPQLPPLPDEFKVDLAVQFDAGSPDGTPLYRLNVVDAAGHVVGTEKLDADMKADDESDDKRKPPPKADASSVITPTDEEREFWKLFEFSQSALPGKPKLLAKWRTRLLDPVAYDPLTAVGGPILRAAELQHLSVVANLEDSVLASASMGSTPDLQPFSASSLDRQVAGWARVSHGANWLIIRPQNFADTRGNRLDRSAVKRLIERTVETNGTTIDDAAEYALSSDSQLLLNSWDTAYAGYLELEDGRRGAMYNADRQAGDDFRLYGNLSPELHEVLRSGRLTVGATPPAVQAIMARSFYWDEETAASATPAYEPTDVLPNGLPQNSVLRLQNEKTDLLVIAIQHMADGVMGVSPARTASSLGNLMANPRSAQLLSSREFRLAQRHSFDIRAQYSPELAGVWSLGELFYPPGPLVNYADLPADFRAQAERARAARQQVMAEMRARQQKPPP
jgi:hypothetical protein